MGRRTTERLLKLSHRSVPPCSAGILFLLGSPMLRKCKPISARPNEQKKRKRKKQKATTTNENKWHPVNCCSIGNYIDSVSMCDGNERATEKSTLTNKWNILSYVMIICLDAAYRMIFFVVVADCDSSTE